MKDDKRLLQATMGFPGGASGKVSVHQCRRCQRCGFNTWVGETSGENSSLLLPGKFYEQRNLAGDSPWDCKESEITKHICRI